MITKEQYEKAREYTLDKLYEAGIALTSEEKKQIEVADFGLDRLEEVGLQLITYVNTNRCCAKELVLMPRQICPEHRHPMLEGASGKEETFRCRKGKVFLYVGGEEKERDAEKIKQIQAGLPKAMEENFTVFHEIILLPGEQYTLTEDTLHWFAAGEEGCIVSEFSTKSVDEKDIFTDANIKRIPSVEE